MKTFFGIVYGALIVLSYRTIDGLAKDQFILFFTGACALLTLGVVPFLSAPFPNPISGVVIRGALYSVSNFLILASQYRGSTYSALTAAFLGSLAVSLPALVRPPYRTKNVLILASFTLGFALLFDQLKLSYLALFSGVLQALTFASASRIMRMHQISIPWNLFIGFGMASIVGIVILLTSGASITANAPIAPILGIATVTVCAQLSFFHLYRVFPVEAASRFSLGRIPWAFGIEMLRTGTILPSATLAGGVFVAIAAFTKRERRTKTRQSAVEIPDPSGCQAFHGSVER